MRSELFIGWTFDVLHWITIQQYGTNGTVGLHDIY